MQSVLDQGWGGEQQSVATAIGPAQTMLGMPAGGSCIQSRDPLASLNDVFGSANCKRSGVFSSKPPQAATDEPRQKTNSKACLHVPPIIEPDSIRTSSPWTKSGRAIRRRFSPHATAHEGLDAGQP